MGKIRVAQKTNEELLADSAQQQNLLAKARGKGKGKNKKFDRGNVYINASYNNISV